MHFKGFVGTMDMTKIIGLSTVFLSILLFEYSSAENQSPIVVYRASKIITLDPDIPTAEAVAVRNERILATGSVKYIQQLFPDQSLKFDSTF